MDAIEAASLADSRYSRVAMWFHWIIAGLIVTNLVIGLTHEGFDRSTRAVVMTLHKSIGLTVLLLSLGRLAWRLGHRPPAFDPLMKHWEVLLARTVHSLFYVLMIALPLSGWLLSSSSGRATNFFWLATVPALPISQSDQSHELWEASHMLLGFSMIGLLFLHLAGVAKHQLEGHRHMIGRMAPLLYRSR
jgi:cytochrome b561